MSNTRKPKDGAFSLDTFRREAKKDIEGGAYVLRLDVDKVIEIPRPTSDQLFDLEESANSREALRAMCGDQADEVLDILGPEDPKVTQRVVESMQEFFGLGN